ncbi:MAG: hypothetical protein HZB56_16600 [Deltaproteobacteria bacterium]|nr:hypothetical protein [Deltaproteobacteria bacterium]
MRTILFALALCASAPAVAQVHVDIQIPLPPMPGLVVVQPGVEVVEAYDEEVFYHRGWFWTRRGPVWYRARSPEARFVHVEPRYVPQTLVRLPPPGHYRHYRAEARASRREWRAEERDRRRDWKAQEKRERRQEREDRKERHEREKEHRGHGHGHDDRGRGRD